MPIEDQLAGSTFRPDVLERPEQAFQSALTGDLPAAWKSMFDPEELTPKQRDVFLRKHGLDKGPFASVFRGLLNPALIISLALAHTFKPATARNLFRLSDQVGSLTSRFPVLRGLASMQAWFRGTDLPDHVSKIVRDLHEFRSVHHEAVGTALRRFKDRVGRLPNQREQIMLSSWLDGLHLQLRGWGGGAEGVVKVGSQALGDAQTLPGVKALMPNLEAHMNRPLKQLAEEVRTSFDSMWKQVYGTPEARRRVAKVLHRIQKGDFTSDIDDISETMHEFIHNPRRIDNYFPHRLVQTEEDFRRLVKAMTDSTNAKGFSQAAQKKIKRWAGPQDYKRNFGMVPDFKDLELISDVVDQKELAKLNEIMKAKVLHKARAGGMLETTLQRLKKLDFDTIRNRYPEYLAPQEAQQMAEAFGSDAFASQYSLKFSPVFSSYVHTLAGTYSWTVRGGGQKVIETLDQLKALSKSTTLPSIDTRRAGVRAEMLENTYIPIIMGRGTVRHAVKAQAWEQTLLNLSLKVDQPKVRNILGNGLADFLVDNLKSTRGAFSLVNMQRTIASHFYLSTLGLNPASALKNMLQLVLTTGPSIGYKTTALGLTNAMKKSHKYFALRLADKTLTHEKALAKIWPEFSAEGLAAAPVTDEAVQATLINAYNIANMPTGSARSITEKAKTAMMAMFTASETTVRLATFEAGLLHAKRAGLPLTEAAAKALEAKILKSSGRVEKVLTRGEFARKLTEQTQFLTGPQNTPFFFLDKSPVVRQLTQFPLRMLEFATSTALTLGSGEQSTILGTNPGTFGRMLAGSIIALELGDMLGVNAGDALLGGAIPTFQTSGKVLAPLPIVPPFFQVLGSGAFALTGDTEEAKRAIPLLVPGGVEISRMLGYLPENFPGAQAGQQVAQFLGRDYADYSRRGPDGRIPVYTANGTLRGYYTEWDILRSGLGIKAGDMRRESEMLQLLVRQRDNIRAARKDYLDARFRNDAYGAARLAQKFQKQFGFPLPVTEDHMKAMQTRRSVSRLEQVLRTLPEGPARQQMVQLISTALGAQGSQLLGLDPMLLGQETAERERQRFQPSRTSKSSPVGRRDLGPLGSVDPQSLGRRPTPLSGFSGF